MQDTILKLGKLNVQLVHKVFTLQVQGRFHILSVLQAITPLILDPHNVKFVLQALMLLLDLVAVLGAQQEPMQNNLEVLNVKFVLQALMLLLDLVAVLSAQQEPMQNNLEVLNVLIVQLGNIHQELDQQAVNPVQ